MLSVLGMSTGLAKLRAQIKLVHEVGCRHVGLWPDAHAEFQKLDERKRGRLTRIFANFGTGLPLPSEQFNNEGRYPTGGKQSKEILIQAFKVWQFRIYGTMVTFDKTPTFVGMSTDWKKQNNADQALLRRTARMFSEFL
jgi:hypothetical protein